MVLHNKVYVHKLICVVWYEGYYEHQQDTAMNFNRNLCATNKVCREAADKYFTILNHSQLNWVWDW